MVALPPPPTPTLSAIYAAYEADPRRRLSRASRRLADRQVLRARALVRLPLGDARAVPRAASCGCSRPASWKRRASCATCARTGATVLDVDPETGRQWRVEAHGGHFGGSLDAVAIGLKEAPKTWHVAEFKTHSAKSFRDLVAKGVALSKPQHWAQMQIYMHLTGHHPGAVRGGVQGHRRSAHRAGTRRRARRPTRLLEKARRVIDAKRPPARICPKIPTGGNAGSAAITPSATRAPRPRSPAGRACTQRRSRAAGTARASITRSIEPRSARLPQAPVRSRSRARRSGRRRRRPCRLPHGRRLAPGSMTPREAVSC